MNITTIKHSGKIETIIVAFILFTITFLITFYKELFVTQSGKIELFNGLGFILVVGLLLRWKYISNVVSVLTFIAMLVMLMTMILTKSFTTPYFFLLIGFSIAFYLSTFSNDVKTYLMNNES